MIDLSLTSRQEEPCNRLVEQLIEAHDWMRDITATGDNTEHSIASRNKPTKNFDREGVRRGAACPTCEGKGYTVNGEPRVCPTCYGPGG